MDALMVAGIFWLVGWWRERLLNGQGAAVCLQIVSAQKAQMLQRVQASGA